MSLTRPPILLALILALLSGAAFAESGYTVRIIELKQEPYSDAKTTQMLPEKTKVEVLKRENGWMQVKTASGVSGWIRMLSLRMTSSAKSNESGIGSLFSLARTGSTGSTVTTGVRGLSEGQLKNAKPNPAELARMRQFSASRADAERYAASEQLAPNRVEYLPVGRKGDAQ